MANCCFCRLVITGAPQDLRRFLTRASDAEGVLSFEQLRPHPELEPSGPGGVVTMQDRRTLRSWCEENWGTPALYDPSTTWLTDSIEDGEVTAEFATAGTPPTWLVEYLIATVPDLSFELLWAEPGFGLGGRLYGEDGESWGSAEAPAGGEEEFFEDFGWSFAWS